MSIASKLFGIWAVNKTVSSTGSLFLRLLAGMAAITVLALTSVIIIAMLIAGGAWLSYNQMVSANIDPQAAALIIGSLLLALLSSIILSAKSYYLGLQHTLKNTMDFQAPVGGNLTRAIEAFLNGFDSGERLR